MKIPERVSQFHEFVLTTASAIILGGSDHHPMFFLDGGPNGRLVIDLRPIFSDPQAKPYAAEAMREVAAELEADFAAHIIEAWTAHVGPGDDPETPTEDRQGAEEHLIIQIEIKGLGLWYWSHKITRDDAGTRVLDVDPEADLIQGIDNRFNRFVMFPADPSPLN